MAIDLWPEFEPDPQYRHTLLSGIEVAQPDALDDVVATSLLYQTFRLPRDFVRGGTSIPELTGLQVCVDTMGTQEEGADTASVNLVLEYNRFGDWTELAKGSARTTRVGTRVWVTAYFNQPIPLTEEETHIQLRVGVQSDWPVFYGTPLLGQSTLNGQSLAFRLLTNSGDSGVDFLGNSYRSYVRRNAVTNVQTRGSSNANSAWLSKPNPSKFAVESLYFDVSDGLGHAKVTDRMLIDPITPGMYATLYYSDEGDPATSDTAWEDKLWQPVFKNWKIDRRLDIPLPEPVTAKFIKVEFTHLQAQQYQPGTFHQPVRYKKHPKWVLDYYMTRLNSQMVTEDPVIARRVRVIYDALALGYDYYLDDLDPSPGVPPTIDEATVTNYLADVSNELDPITLNQVWEELKPYAFQPAARGSRIGSLLGEYVSQVMDTNSYPTENIRQLRANTTIVSTLDRMPVLIEQNMPVMMFFVNCRHKYREVEASFDSDKAYFAGLREIAFTREHYTVASDTPLYIDNLSDAANTLRNDFLDEEYIPFNPNPAPVA